ncbi:MAG: hypothetical protein P1U40_06405 [Coxiellaceae bacterium]|nr:hypothetical protein [Coxiellaceae bacterium]
MRGSKLAAGLFNTSMVAAMGAGAWQNRKELQQGFRDAEKLAETSGFNAKLKGLTDSLPDMPKEEFDPVESTRHTFGF